MTPLMRPSNVAPIRSDRKFAISRSIGLALGLHGAPLGGRDARRDLVQRGHVHAVRQAIGAEVLRADQRAMHHEIGIAADRRGVVRVALQIEAEVAVVLGRIFRLRLAAQRHLVDQRLVLGAFHARQYLVEVAGPHHLALGQVDVERGEEFAQRLDLLRARLVVHAVDQRRARPLQSLGGRHIGEDHEFLDQPVRIETRRNDHAIDGAVGFQQDLALGQVEIERLAFLALVQPRAIGGIERLDHR